MAIDHQALGRLAVLGDSFDITLASEVTGIEVGDLLGILDRAGRDGLIRVEAGLVHFDPGRRAEIQASMGAAENAAAHAGAARVLAATRPSDFESFATHMVGAIAVVGAGPAIDALEAAAAAAERMYDWEAAALRLGEAAALARQRHDPRALELELKAARLHFRAGRFAEAMTGVRAVARAARVAADHRVLAEACLVIRGIGDREICAELLDLGREALAGLRESEPDLSLRARLVSQLAILRADLDRSPADAERAAQALALAEASGEPRAIIEALHATQRAHCGARAVLQRLALADRAESLASEAGLEELRGLPLAWRMDALFQLGQRPALDEAIARLEEHGVNRNDALARWKARMALAELAVIEGRFDDAERLGGEAVELARLGGHDGAEFVYKILRSWAGFLTASVIEDAKPIEAFPRGGEAMLAFPAMEEAALGHLDRAAVFLDQALPAIDQLRESEIEVQAYCALAMVAWALDRVDVAPVVRAALAPFAAEMAEACTGQAASMGSVARYLGQMAALEGDWDAVETDFALAIRRNMEVGNRPAVVQVRLDWARALLRRGLARDRERAEALLEAGLRDAQRLGMPPLADLAVRTLDSLRSGPAHPLSARELEVALLVAAGLSNKEVAARLHLSVRTAENHLLNVMNKLGLDNRAQVAAWATRNIPQGAPNPHPA